DGHLFAGAPQGQESPCDRHRQRPIDRLGLRQGFPCARRRSAVTYLNDKSKTYVEPLAREVKAEILMPLDLQKEGQLEAVFDTIDRKWGRLDLGLDSIAFAPREAVRGRVVDVSKKGFLTAREISCWSFIRMAKLAEPLMKNGGTLYTMTYYGSQMVVEHYN